MQHGAIIPHQQVAHGPAMGGDKAILGGMGPRPIEQRLAVFGLESDDIAPRPASREQAAAPGLAIGAHQRLTRARRVSYVVDLLVALISECRRCYGLIIVEGLVTESQHQVVALGRFDPFELSLAQPAGDLDASDLCAEGVAAGSDFDCPNPGRRRFHRVLRESAMSSEGTLTRVWPADPGPAPDAVRRRAQDSHD